MSNCLLIGEDHFLIECAEILLQKKFNIVALISTHENVQEWTIKHRILFFNSFKDVDKLLQNASIDYLFSIVNSKIIPNHILSKVKRFAINYHHSPLPKYAGVNAPSWAILNAETHHGVTWHVMTEQIDGGDILKQDVFRISANETALSLSLKCYRHALILFSELADELLKNSYIPKSQNLKKRTYYHFHNKPRGNAWVNWKLSAEEIDRCFRATYFGIHDNTFSLLKFKINQKIFILNELKITHISSFNKAPGTVTSITPYEWRVATSTHDISITQIIALDGIDCDLEELAHTYNVTVEDVLPSPTEKELNLFEKKSIELAKHELYWLQELSRFQPATLPFLSQSKTNQINSNRYALIQKISLPNSLLATINEQQYLTNFLLTTLLIYLYRLENKEHNGVFLMVTKNGITPQEINDFFAVLCPFQVHLNKTMNFNSALAHIAKHLKQSKNKNTYLRDLYYRYHSLTKTHQTIAIILEEQEPIDVYPFNATVIIKLSTRTQQIKWYLSEPLTQYNSFFLDFIKKSSQHCLTLITSILKDKTTLIQHLSILTDEEKRCVLVNWNDTQAPYPKDKSISTLLDEVSCKYPLHIALKNEQYALTYQQLASKVNRLANYFVYQIKIKSQEAIIVALPRGIEWIISLLAILKIGAIYVPITMDTPTKRRNAIINDVKANYILSEQNHICEIKSKIELDLSYLDIDKLIRITNQQSNELSSALSESTHTAYILYTSGTTGQPKGVVIGHQSLVNLACSQSKKLAISNQEKVLQFASIGFDASIWEVFTTLIGGGMLCIPNHKKLLVGSELVEVINYFKITFLTISPSILYSIKPYTTPSLKTIVVAGEACTQDLTAQWVNSTRFLNAYGPTEATVCATIADVEPKSPVTIGQPIANTRVYVLDEYLQPVPVGIAGELYISGSGLALEYLNKPELTQQFFVHHIFAEHSPERLYKTRDLVRWLPTGHIEYLGRIDNQVKLRGFRIEIEAIEANLLQINSITQCAVALKEPSYSGKMLVAYLVTSTDIDLDKIKAILKETLPDYMIPNNFIFMDSLPLTENGKIDRKSLPNPEFSTSDNQHPMTELEAKLMQIWQQVLGLKQFSIYDDFFALGGNSLLLSQLIFTLKEELHFDMHFTTFLKKPTIVALAEIMTKKIHHISDELYNKRFLADAKLDSTIYPIPNNSTHASPNNILLTGATGFLGAHLLESLYQNTPATIFCLVRSSSNATASEKLMLALKKYCINVSIDKRIIVIDGNLDKPNLGLSASTYETIAIKVDTIYHNGAFVNHLYHYEMLRPANVLSTIEILKLASYKKNKTIHYISTLSAVCNLSVHDRHIFEELLEYENEKPPTDGYNQTKWVSEKLLAEAVRRNFNIYIYRPGWIFGNSITGIFPFSGNHLLLLIQGCIQLGIAPNWKVPLNILPVDFVSKLIVNIACSASFEKQVFNLINHHQITWIEIINHLNQNGHQVKLVPSDQWVKTVNQIDRNNALFYLLPIYMHADHSWENELNKVSKVHDANTQLALDQFQISQPLIDQNMLAKCFSFLQKQYAKNMLRE